MNDRLDGTFGSGWMWIVNIAMASKGDDWKGWGEKDVPYTDGFGSHRVEILVTT